jgi:putative ABC transport system substrate-binding protein
LLAPSAQRRFAEGNIDRLQALAAELVSLNPDLVVAAGGDAITRAVKDASGTIPIVTAVGEDPIASGLVATLARPGSNVTGMTSLTRFFSAKRLQLVKEIEPRVSTVGVVWNSVFPNKVMELKATQAAAETLGIRIIDPGIQNPGGLDGAFEEAIKGEARALISLPDPLTNVLAPRIIQFARTHRLPTMFSQRPHVDIGGLMSYGPNDADLFRLAATYVDKILKGATPADLPMEQPTKFELVLNLRTAKEIGLSVPPRPFMS